ncbi:HPF/RaiA family ribosome-associated protein [Sphingomonas sp. NPDC019816]|uniref:HPF/RaiA family ribosome-associated protein n=1 Tax=unclassified Sphingomonas TaxID=196159 RepID=UPI00289B9382|nr:HPF/RaiA family ribosome-associated protein [Sphingomonas sp.]
MLVQINTDNRVEGSEATNKAIEERVRERLSRFAERLTRVEMHLRDVDGDRNGSQGIEAKLEARPAGGQPIVVTDQAGSTDSAVAGVVRKAADALDRAFGKQDAVR